MAIIADALFSLHYALMKTQIAGSYCGESGDHGEGEEDSSPAEDQFAFAGNRKRIKEQSKYDVDLLFRSSFANQ